jgi:hypothetical protein
MSNSYHNFKFKKDRVAYIRKMLESNEKWVLRALVTIFRYQTAAEQNAEATLEHNGVGFTGADGEFLSSLAKQVKRGRTMSVKQMHCLFKKMPKYAGQLDCVAQSKLIRSF